MSQSRIFLAPCASERPKQHFEEAVKTGVSAELYREYTNQDFGDTVGLWGVTEALKGTWDDVEQGDYLLFYFGEGRYQYATKVLGTEQNKDLAMELWPNVDDTSAGGADTTDPWKLLIYIDSPIKVDIDSAELHGAAGYAQNYPMKFMPLNETGHTTIRDEYSSIEDYIRAKRSSPGVWIEKTQQEGRDYKQEGELALGNALLSPSRDEGGRKRYETMREADVGDIVLHLLQERHEIVGVSRIASELQEDFEGPPADHWTDEQREQRGYLRKLEDYTEVDEPVKIYDDILENDRYIEDLQRIRDEVDHKIIYSKRLALNQGHYFTKVPNDLLAILTTESEELRRQLDSFGVTPPEPLNELPDPVASYENVTQAVDDISERLEQSATTNWLADELTKSVVNDWSDVLTAFGPGSTVTPAEEVRLEQIRQLYKNSESRLRETAEELGSGELNDINKSQTLFMAFLRDIQSRIGITENVNQVKVKIILIEKYEVGSADGDEEDDEDEEDEQEKIQESHPLFTHLNSLPTSSPIRIFTGPPDYWLTALQYGTVSFEEGEERETWQSIEEGELVFLHSQAEPSDERVDPQPSGIFAVGILGSKTTKDEMWWIDETETEPFPYLVSFQRLFVTSNVDQIDLSTPVGEQSQHKLEDQLSALTGDILDFETIQEICEKTNGIRFPAQGAHKVFRDESNEPDHERPRALLKKIVSQVQEVSTVHTHSPFNGNISTEPLDGLYFPGEQKAELVEQIETALRTGKHVILTGPPGTGKTEIARRICRYLADEYPYLYSDFQLTTATADWSTFDTVGGYMPEETDDGGDDLAFTPGIVLNRLKDRRTGCQQNEPLVIDELNRADIDKAFGQLFTLLSGQSVQLPFTQDGFEIELLNADSLQTQPDTHQYVVPESWRIFATMNTYDKTSLYEMSYAFMRRFAFIRVSAPEIPDDEGIEDFMLEYMAVWDLNAGRRECAEVGRVWRATNTAVEERAIGPAIVKDMLAYITDNDTLPLGERLTRAIISFIFPQLEGVPKRKQILQNIARVQAVDEDALDRAAIDMLQQSIQTDE